MDDLKGIVQLPKKKTKKKFGERRAERRRRVELLVLSGKGVSEIASQTGYSEDTIRGDVEFLQEQWAQKPEAKDAYDKRVATLKAMSQYALEESCNEKNPANTRISWFQGWYKMGTELAELTGTAKYAEQKILSKEAIKSALEIVGEIWEGEYECPECGYRWGKDTEEEKE